MRTRVAAIALAFLPLVDCAPPCRSDTVLVTLMLSPELGAQIDVDQLKVHLGENDAAVTKVAAGKLKSRTQLGVDLGTAYHANVHEIVALFVSAWQGESVVAAGSTRFELSDNCTPIALTLKAPGTPDHATLSFPPANPVANGTDLALGTVAVLDAGGDPVPGVALTIDVTEESLTFQRATGATGEATFSFNSTVPGLKHVIVSSDQGQLVAGTVTFDAGAATKIEVTHAPAPSVSEPFIANGMAQTVIKIVVKDRFENVIPNPPLMIRVFGGLDPTGASNTLSSPMTQPDGSTQVTLQSTIGESKTVLVTSGNAAPGTDTITFVPNRPSLVAFTATQEPGDSNCWNLSVTVEQTGSQSTNLDLIYEVGPRMGTIISHLIAPGDFDAQHHATFNFTWDSHSQAPGEAKNATVGASISTLGQMGDPGKQLVVLDNGPRLASPIESPVGSNALGMVAIDMNGDHKVDLAVADASGCEILISGGDGHVSSLHSYAIPTPNGIAGGDFNSDGTPDLAVSSTNGSIYVLIGQGAGSFSAPVGYPLVAQGSMVPTGLAVADFNGDAKLDVVVAFANATNGSNLIHALIGAGDGSFTIAQQPLSIVASPIAIASGDFDSDLQPDLAVAVAAGPSSNPQLLMLWGKRGSNPTTISFDSALIGNYSVSALTSAFIDGESTMDIAFSDGQSLWFASGIKDRMLAAALAGPANASALIAADLNLDGKNDVIGAQNAIMSGIGAHILLGNGDGSFAQPHDTIVGGQNDLLGALAAGDLSGDGKPDLAIAALDGRLFVLLNQQPTSCP